MPYFYIHLGIKSINPLDNDFLYKLADCIERSVTYHYKHRKFYKNELEANPYIIHSLEWVKKYSIYGYRKMPLDFIKIVIYNPKHIKIISDILASGAIFHTEMQPYEVLWSGSYWLYAKVLFWLQFIMMWIN